MSTYIYLRCEDHTPPLLSVDESGQHFYDVPRIRKEIADRAALVKAWEHGAIPSGYFEANSVRFLVQHQQCRIGIVTEYGEDVPIEEPESTDGSER